MYPFLWLSVPYELARLTLILKMKLQKADENSQRV